MQGNSNSKSASRLERRKILKWLGVGAVGAFVLRMLPLKSAISKKVMKTDKERISISINKSAVKRNKAVGKNV